MFTKERLLVLMLSENHGDKITQPSSVIGIAQIFLYWRGTARLKSFLIDVKGTRCFGSSVELVFEKRM